MWNTQFTCIAEMVWWHLYIYLLRLDSRPVSQFNSGSGEDQGGRTLRYLMSNFSYAYVTCYGHIILLLKENPSSNRNKKKLCQLSSYQNIFPAEIFVFRV